MTPAYIEKVCAELDAEILALAAELEDSACDPDVCEVEFSAMYETFLELECRRIAIGMEHEL